MAVEDGIDARSGEIADRVVEFLCSLDIETKARSGKPTRLYM